MKVSIVALVSLLAVAQARKLKAVEHLPLIADSDLVNAKYAGLEDESAEPLVSRNENGLEKRACSSSCYPYLCNGRCCHYNKCCKNECCQPVASGCNSSGRCVVTC